MKRYLLFLLYIVCCATVWAQADPPYPTAPGALTNVVAAEYYIDTDPGYGNATSIAISPGTDIVSTAFNASTNGLSIGVHRIVVRTKSNDGRWSIIALKDFLYDFDTPYGSSPAAPQNVTAAEYFIDTDPGIGNGTAIALTAGTDISNVSAAIDLTGLPTGTHRLYIRTKSVDGKWSFANIREFIIDFDPVYSPSPTAPQNIVAAEYFIDADPGLGSATAISVSAGLDINSILFPANVSGLSVGTHRLFIRTKSSEGRWSITNIRDFIVDLDYSYPPAPAAPSNIVSAEYFIDTDPGVGNGNAISVSAGIDISDINFAANTTGLSIGTHRIFLRTKSNTGAWSIVNVKDFIVDLDFTYPAAPPAAVNVVAAEYFIDTDPGAGNATPIAVTAGTDISNIAATVATNGLAVGPHHLFLRTRAADGKWSITNARGFNIGTLTILPDSISFLSTLLNSTATRSLVIKNNSASTQSVTGLSVAAPFTSDLVGTRNIPAGQADTIHISFTPTLAQNYQDIIQLQTSAGQYNIPVKGTGIAVINSWVIEPATGHNYGNVQTGGTANFTFTVRNTGNTSITLNQASTGNSVFVPTFTSGTVIPVGGTINLAVAFNPVAVTSYTGMLKIIAGAGGPDSVTTALSGNGFTPATAPALSLVAAAPYDGARGVNPAAGQTGNYTYKIVYRSQENRAPANGYPQVAIDLNGDQDFDDAGEGMFAMSKEGSSTDYAAGVVYTYTASYSNYSNTMGYKFFANDLLGNAATGSTGYFSGPVVTYQLLDLKLFASDISFSKSNPLPGESFTVTANITNNSAFNATNVPVSFYRDTILIGSTTIPTVAPFSVTTVTRLLSFGADGFYPIKVWADPNNILNDANVLNNYAIRPVIVGNPVLPGGITVTGSTTVQNCPSQKLIFTGHADYFGTSIPTAVAGAEVTINTGTSIIKTTTDASGNYRLVMENPPCGNTIIYTVRVTDFTFTSNTFTGAENVTCPAPNACTPPPASGGGGASIFVSGTPCDQVVGSNSTAQLTIKYRGRNAANMWGLWDKIWKDTVKVFNNGVLIQTYYTDDIPDFGSAGTFPGDEKIIPVTVPLSSAGPNNITVIATYLYNEFYQNETPFYHGVFIPMTATASTTIFAQPAKPDLTLGNFQQPTFRTLTFDDINNECTPAGTHIVRVVDITNPGAPVLVQSNTISTVGGKSSVPVSVNLSSLSIGTHVLRVITDTTAVVDETNEGNNVFHVTLDIPAPDLTVGKVSIAPTSLVPGSTVNFTATIRNTGTAAGAFTVRFLANGVPVGSDVSVTGIGEKGSVTVSSAGLNISTNDFDCPIDITVLTDAGSAISEGSETNNSFSFKLGSDIQPLHLPGEFGSISNPVRVRVNTSKQFNAYIRNTGTRDITNVTVKFVHNGVKIGEALVPLIKAGEQFPAVASFTHIFDTPGATVVTIETDTANTVCEIDEANNSGAYHIVVTDSKEDFVVLSQYISPSSLNPNTDQNITIVGTVKNIGNKVAPPSTLRFYVDDIPLGAPVAFNSLQIGQDTTVAATVTYSSQIAGVKVIKLRVDAEGLVSEEDENNNEATRTIIVGDAPDMVRNAVQPILFNPSGFNAGDSVTISYQVRNSGTNAGTAWARFKVFDAAGTLTAIDSVQFTLQPSANTTLFRKMFFAIDSGFVAVEIANCTPTESNLLNNTDTLYFSTVAKMKANLIVNNLDMKAGAPQQLPGWIGGKIVLGDYDLTINGFVVNVDTAHFFVTNGTGKLKIINSSTQNLFPVGTSLHRPNFVKISNTGTPDNFSVRVAPYVLRNGNSGDTIRTGNVNRTWFIEEQVAGGSNATVELFWSNGDELPGFDRTVSRVGHFSSGWQLGDIGNALTDTNAQYSRSHNGYNNFSPFTVTSGTGLLVPLRFIDFTAAPVAQDIQLNWITEAEQNTSHFGVEFSTDGLNFAEVGQVKSTNRSGQQRYSFRHLSPNGNILYYRLRQVDMDGRFEYSRIVRVNRTASNVISLYPNPASNFLTVRNVQPNDIQSIQIFSADGKLVQTAAPNSQMTFDVSRLKNGMYTLYIIRKNAVAESKTFIKQ